MAKITIKQQIDNNRDIIAKYVISILDEKFVQINDDINQDIQFKISFKELYYFRKSMIDVNSQANWHIYNQFYIKLDSKNFSEGILSWCDRNENPFLRLLENFDFCYKRNRQIYEGILTVSEFLDLEISTTDGNFHNIMYNPLSIVYPTDKYYCVKQDLWDLELNQPVT